MQIGDNELLTGYALLRNQIIAMVMKKVLSTLRAWILLFIQVIMPVVFLIIAIVVARNMDTNRDLPELELTLDSYDDPVTVLSGFGNYMEQYANILNNSNHIYTNLSLSSLPNYILQKVSINNLTNILYIGRYLGHKAETFYFRQLMRFLRFVSDTYWEQLSTMN